jgi:tetratricopeptide (TPR) repeat protein
VTGKRWLPVLGIALLAHATRAPAQDAMPEPAPPPAAEVLDAAPMEAAPLAVEAQAPAPAMESVPPPAAVPARAALWLERIERAWSAPAPARNLVERASRARAAADEAGIANVEPLARAALLDASGASPQERAQAAVLLAPDLPVAHAARARAAWQSGAFAEALAAAQAALYTLPRHLEGWIWLGATGAVLAIAALAGGALIFLAARAAHSARFVAHDLGDRIEPSMPAFARIALVAAVALVPAALGEGPAGVALGLFALALLGASREQCIAVSLAAALFVAAIHPLARFAAARLAVVGSDPVALASWAAESGVVDPVDALRLLRASEAAEDPLALQALAQWARRSGELAVADQRYAALLEQAGPDPVVLNNAAGVKLALGEPKAAIDLYRRAIEVEPSALLWFNLSQAHGADIDVEQHDRALAAAQSLDPIAVSELTKQLAGATTPYAAERALSQPRVRDRLLAVEAVAAAAELRRPLAPGWLGASPWIALAAFGALGVLVLALAARMETSSACLDCGAHLCRRCGTAPRGDGRCEPCQKRRFQGRAGAAWERRGSRSLGDRALRALRWIGAGAFGRRSATGLPAAVLAVGAAALLAGHDAVLPDPAAVGGAGALAAWAAAAVAVAAWLALAAVAGLRERRGRS